MRFEKCNYDGFSTGVVGIMKAGHKFNQLTAKVHQPPQSDMLYYNGSDGDVYYKGTRLSNNAQFKDGQLIAMELNADVGTLHFFVDGIQQPVFVSEIFQAVKFWFYINLQDSSFSVVSVKKLTVPTAKTLSREKAIQW
ncbi:MAG: hypothetical protein EZS28_022303 [Streblomastix strix]|uniref:B30.2/SPRY domain-containing protein n=1 Tax=Streblomastix strix TaxID=222440 RepID=A0A5J4VHY2_9EUKA|nr:MAG: hypothetical protein EZS28_022303 [Streblomastix strix]